MLHRVEHAGTWLLTWLGFRSRWVQTDAGRVHVLERGAEVDAPALVLIHGIGASHVHWFFTVLRLFRHVPRIVIPDLPNHGWSERGSFPPSVVQSGFLASMREILDRPAWVVGNSLGGLASIGLAVHAPERVRGLMLVSPGGAAETPEQFAVFMEQFRFTDREGARAFLERIYRRPPWYLSVLVGPILREFTRPGFRRFVDSAKPNTATHGAALSGLTVPVTLVWGTEDRLMPDHHRQWYLDHVPPQATVVEPAMGHCPHLDDSRPLANMIREFVRSA